MKRTAVWPALAALFALAACGQPGLAPGSGALGGVRAESAVALPGESAMGLPGESAMGLPGAGFACTGLPLTAAASCTVAFALDVKPNPNPNEPADLLPGLHPDDLRSAYGLPSANAGGLVAVVDAYDAPTAEADLAVYRLTFGLPACTSLNGCFRKLNQSGAASAYPAPNAGWSEEAALDLEMVSAVCPKCSIVLVEANSAAMNDLGAAVVTAAKLHPRAVSNSYYAIEWSGERALDADYDHPGIAMTASSGDRGYAAYPATSPYVTAVGGTSLSRSSSGWDETAWAYDGRGCSAYEPRPAFQSAVLQQMCKGTRASVDLAVVGDPSTGVATFTTAGGGWLVAGGTSVGAPIVAATYALAPAVEPLSYTYAHPAALRKLSSESYALQTGLGAPAGVGAF